MYLYASYLYYTHKKKKKYLNKDVRIILHVERLLWDNWMSYTNKNVGLRCTSSMFLNIIELSQIGIYQRTRHGIYDYL